jgi:mannose-1-phosphate guanylyltransferase/mannose-6-phosphate isomerase
MNSVILCGGSGTRLWPLSRKNYPKQFLNLYSDKSLLQETFLRMRRVMPAENIYFITGENHFFNVLNQIKEVYPKIEEKNIIIEPESKNTLPAIAYAVRYLLHHKYVRVSDPILFAPSDHYIADNDSFSKLVKKMAIETKSSISTIGITPMKPEIGYGYIKKGKKNGAFFQVSAFKEKPERYTAVQYISSGDFVWNSGMYMLSAETFVRELKEHEPDTYKIFDKGLDFLTKNFSKLFAVAFDRGISEKSKRIIVFEGNFGWSDVGSFDSMAELAKENNIINERHVHIDSKNIFVHSAGNRLVATIGVDDLIIIENHDSILVYKKGLGEGVKKVLQHLEDNHYPESDHNIIVHRPWGRYEVLVDMPEYKVKKLVVYPGAKLSTQSHEHRSEHWTVVSGTARARRGEEYLVLKKDEGTFIPARTIHSLENPGRTNLEIVEVQTGTYFGEEDIVRYEDIYRRA